jgi:geranylgeranyl pyrophosphate synthase
MTTALTLDMLYKPVQAEVELVRARVNELWSTALRLVDASIGYRPEMGGKLLRPALCLLSAGAVGARNLEHFVTMAASMELLHVASLVHDDVVDGSDVRRGARSLNKLWNNHTAVLGGDYLVARALDSLTTYDSCPVIANATESIRLMAEGELVNYGLGDATTERDALRWAEGKTASFFAVTCSTPALLVDPSKRDPLFRFGMAMGVAFQLVDDILDLTQSSVILGKPACGDVVEGKNTLPLLYLAQALAPAARARLAAMRGEDLAEDDRQWIAEQVVATGAVERTEAVARQYIDEAREALETNLAPSPCRDSMAGIAEFILIRAS